MGNDAAVLNVRAFGSSATADLGFQVGQATTTESKKALLQLAAQFLRENPGPQGIRHPLTEALEQPKVDPEVGAREQIRTCISQPDFDPVKRLAWQRVLNGED